MPTLEIIQANLTLVILGDINYYFSYNSHLATYTTNGGLVINENCRMSATTRKHLNIIKQRHGVL